MAPRNVTDALFLLPLLFVSILSQPDFCYHINGRMDLSSATCWDPDLGENPGLCCQKGDLCLNSTLCATPSDSRDGYSFYRGTCTDMRWDNSFCPQYCVDSTGQRPFIRRCRNDDDKWYCETEGRGDNDDCGPDYDTFVPPGVMQAYAIAGVKNEKPLETTSADESTTTTATSTAESDAATATDAVGDPVYTTTPTEEASRTSYPGIYLSTDEETPTAEPTSEAGPPTASPDTADAQQDAPQGGDTSGAAIPIGVGVAVGATVLMAAGALLFFYQRKRRRQAPVRAETPPPFEFAVINNQAPQWLGPSYGPKPPAVPEKEEAPEPSVPARAELP